MRQTEEPVVRPYWLVDDIETAVAAAEEAGAKIAQRPLEIPGHGTFAIYIYTGRHPKWPLEEVDIMKMTTANCGKHENFN